MDKYIIRKSTTLSKVLTIYLTLFTTISNLEIYKLIIVKSIKYPDKTADINGWNKTNQRQMTGGNMVILPTGIMDVCPQSLSDKVTKINDNESDELEWTTDNCILAGWKTTNQRKLIGGKLETETNCRRKVKDKIKTQEKFEVGNTESTDKIPNGWSIKTDFVSNFNHWKLTHKKRNKITKCTNGNRNMKTLTLMEWTTGSTHWARQQELIQATVDENSPDIIFITEANVKS